ncbi:STAS/SEC14 domain-containing protein [Haloferula sargassicola]|uniref:STAS/SEC14 domain-containing protein n=1 Tax=Haloferula sargassicola TaxID=490096 RepID=A0ABP9UQT3_9BACT
MVDSQILPNRVLVLRPSGPISKEDIAAVREKVDALLASGGHLAGVLIEAPGFPGWHDFGAMSSHLSFVREHHRDVPRVAIVSDSRFLAALPKLARHFVQAEFHHFAAGETEAALAWAAEGKPKAPSALRYGWFPDRKLVWFYVHGRVHTEDYRKAISWMEGIFAETSPVSFLIDLQDLEGIDAGAIMADMRFGMKHLKDIHRIALVGNEKWTRKAASLPNLFKLELKAFPEAEEHQAWDWATAG